jgi:ABC-2 type transport system permease protein
VLAAKLLAGLVWCLVAFAASLAVAAIAVAIGGVPGAFDVATGIVFQDLLYVAFSVIGGIAFGAALLASAPAIVLYFVLPIAWSIVGSLAFLEGAAKWLDSSRTFSPMLEELLSGKQWAQIATTVAVWMALPLAIGMWRILKGEVR